MKFSCVADSMNQKIEDELADVWGYFTVLGPCPESLQARASATSRKPGGPADENHQEALKEKGTKTLKATTLERYPLEDRIKQSWLESGVVQSPT